MIYGHQKIIFPFINYKNYLNILNDIPLGSFLCTDQFLIKHYGFKMQGKRDITSYTKCYDVIAGRQGKYFFSKHSHISLERSFIADHFLPKDHDLKIT